MPGVPTAIAVFAKPPIRGNVKTRLGSTIGNERAATLAAAFLMDTLNGLAVDELAETRVVVASPQVWEAPGHCEVWIHGAGTLGHKLERIFRRGFSESHHVVVALGADAPGLPAHLISEAIARITRHEFDAVIGPADDGGFYLLALAECPEGLFEDIPWSGPETCAMTEQRLRDHGLRVCRLAPWFDVDDGDSLSRLLRMARDGEISAPATLQVAAPWLDELA